MVQVDYKALATHEFPQHKRLHRYKAAFSGLGRGVLAAVIVLEILRTVVGGHLVKGWGGRPEDPLAEATKIWAQAVRAPAAGQEVSGKARTNYFPAPKNKAIMRSRKLLVEPDLAWHEVDAVTNNPATRRLGSAEVLAAHAGQGLAKPGDVHEVRLPGRGCLAAC